MTRAVGRSKDVLVLLTDAYPFGAAEPFLDAELPVLARHFERILLLPSRAERAVRPLPPGVEHATDLVQATVRARDWVLREPWRMLSTLGRAVVQEPRAWPYLRHPRTYLHVIARNCAKYRALRSLIRTRGLQDAIFYDYWLENSTLALSWLRTEGGIRRAVARAHRFDLYDDAWDAGATPFRAFKVASLDRTVLISAHGLEYLRARTPEPVRHKLVLSRLGVRSGPTSAPPRSAGTRPLVVSCARLVPFKRIDRIPQVLSRVGRDLRWIHFGDGPERVAVERAASALDRNVEWTLAGHLQHEEVLRFFASTPVDLMLSLSASEGLPVSMMEAIAHGIPVVACAANGVPEIVNERTGRLVGVDASPDEIAAGVRAILDGHAPSFEELRSFFMEQLDAELNFERFADLLHAV